MIRAGQILVDAYHNASDDAPQMVKVDPQSGVVQVKHTENRRAILTPTSNFTPDLVDQIHLHVLASLGRTRTPTGLALLCEVASTPPKKIEKDSKKLDEELFLRTGSDQGITDLRLAALRSLANYKGEQAAIDVCYNILEKEKTPALRNRAHEGLKQLTGKNADPNPAAWAAVLGKVETPPVKSTPDNRGLRTDKP